MDTAKVDAEGNRIVSLERKSVQPYRSQDEYLYAMKEDLAEWFNTLYSADVTVDDFLEYLETGVVLCQHANKVNEYIVEQLENGRRPRDWSSDALELARQVIQYKSNVKAGSFQSRDNISNYLSWCRWTLGIPDTLLFESDDLVMRKNERNVVLCVLEVARRGARFGMLAPCLVQLEQEIDAEIAGEEPPPRPAPQRPRYTIDMMSLDEMVREIAKGCTCPDQFPIIRVSEGKYKVGESLTLIFVRILRNHVMVRIGGGWDTLENYLNRHDPCRCDASRNQHKTRRFSQAAAKRRSSMTSPAPLSYPDSARPRKLPPTPIADTSTNRATIDGLSPRSNPDSQKSGASPGGVERANTDRRRPASAKVGKARARSPAALSGTTPSQRITASPAPSRRAANQPAASFVKPEPIRPQPKRPSSAGPTAPQNLQTPRKLELSSGSSAHSRTPKRDENGDSGLRSRHVRSRSVGAEELRRNMLRFAPGPDNGSGVDVIMISRDKSGRHVVNKPGDNRGLSNTTVPITNGNGAGNGVGNTERRPNSARMKISPDKLLPSKPKAIMRSQSVEAKSLLDQSDSVPGSSTSINSDVTSERSSFKRQNSTSSLGSFGSAADLCDMPAPIGDHKLNKEMEKLFEEYRRAEKGWFHYDDADEEVDMLSASASSTRSAPEYSGSRSARPASAGPSRRNLPTPASRSGRRTPTQATGASRIRPTTPTTPFRAAASGTLHKDGTPVRSSVQTPSVISKTTSSSTPAGSRRGSVTSAPPTRRARTPNPTATAVQTPTPARSQTPLVHARSEDVKPRIDTGLRKRPTTPLSTPKTDDAARRKPAARSSSLSRVAIQRQLTSNADGETFSIKRRSRSKDDILDDDTGTRRSRSETARKRDVLSNGRRSASRDPGPARGSPSANSDAIREPPRSLPPTPGTLITATPPDPVTVEIPTDATACVDRPSTPYAAKPRKDDQSKPKTRIPRPSSARPFQSPTPEAGLLKRFDSGVDINVSPTENNSVQGDEDLCHHWQPAEAVTLREQTLGYAAVTEASDEYY